MAEVCGCAQTQNSANAQIEVMPVQGNVYMVTSAGGNVTLQVGKEGAVLVDTTLAPLAPAILAEIKAHERAAALHHQHPRPSGSCRRQRGVGDHVTGAHDRSVGRTGGR